jgi:hypothetical protein
MCVEDSGLHRSWWASLVTREVQKSKKSRVLCRQALDLLAQLGQLRVEIDAPRPVGRVRHLHATTVNADCQSRRNDLASFVRSQVVSVFESLHEQEVRQMATNRSDLPTIVW